MRKQRTTSVLASPTLARLDASRSESTTLDPASAEPLMPKDSMPPQPLVKKRLAFSW